jgi:hypothetical protein
MWLSHVTGATGAIYFQINNTRVVYVQTRLTVIGAVKYFAKKGDLQLTENKLVGWTEIRSQGMSKEKDCI